jgi:hypothetical protein
MSTRVGLLLTMFGVLLPHCFALAIIGLTLTALAVGTDWQTRCLAEPG